MEPKREDKNLLVEFRKMRHLLYDPKRKKRTESQRDFILRTANFTCTYCGIQYPKKSLSVVRKNPNLDAPKVRNSICACRKCAEDRAQFFQEGSLVGLNRTHKDYRKHLFEKRMQIRQDILKNYRKYAKETFEKYNFTCIYCVFEYGFMPSDRKLTMDHKVPLIRCGTNDIRNRAACCYDHNQEKGDMTADEFFSYLEERLRKAHF